MSRGKIMYQKVWTWKKRDYIILYYTEYANKDKDKAGISLLALYIYK